MMRKTHIKLEKALLTSVVFIFICNTSYAQGVLTYVADGSVYLKWKIAFDKGLEGYDVYRKSTTETTWKKLNEITVHRFEKPEDIKKVMGEDAAVFTSLFKAEAGTNITEEVFQKAVSDENSKSFLGMLSVINPEYGKALGTEYSDKPEAAGNYQYKIEKVVNGNSTVWANSSSVSVGLKTTEMISSALIKAANPMNEAVELVWDKNAALLKSGKVVSYNVYRAENPVGPFVKVNYQGMMPVEISSGNQKSGATTQNYIDRYLTNGKTYYYQLKAVNAFGFESEASLTVEATPADDRKPLPAGNIKIEPYGGRVKIDWNGSSKASGFEVYRSEDLKKSFVKIHPVTDLNTDTSRSIIDFNAQKGKAYYYFITSLAGDLKTKNYSDTVLFEFEDYTLPPAPENIKAVASNGKIIITWNAVKTDDIAGYEIERAADDQYKTRFSLNKTLITNTTFTDDPKDNSERKYGYVIYSVRKNGIRSKASEMIFASLPDKTPPAAPVITAIYPNGIGVQIFWESNMEGDISGYEIQRKTANDKFFLVIGRSDSLHFKDTLQSDGERFYQIVAIDTSGNRSPLSKAVATSFNTTLKPFASPTGSALLKDEKIIITWEKPALGPVAGFVVYRKNIETGKSIMLKEMKANELELTDVYALGDKSYEYRIITFDEKGRESPALIVRYVPETKGKEKGKKK
ncbi:MAG: hypothetical protein GC181_07340 [Bacteroidetes bacterium]|nr:hypothetical protein [Bacteroidota bacterium]